jgi:hypothetical protein
LIDVQMTFCYILKIFSPVAQQVERVAVNHLVGGSSPSRGAISIIARYLWRAFYIYDLLGLYITK